jgi:hypothetical protein
VGPAGKALEAQQLTRRERDDWLVKGQELLSLDGGSQFGLNIGAARVILPHGVRTG